MYHKYSALTTTLSSVWRRTWEEAQAQDCLETLLISPTCRFTRVCVCVLPLFITPILVPSSWHVVREARGFDRKSSDCMPRRVAVQVAFTCRHGLRREEMITLRSQLSISLPSFAPSNDYDPGVEIPNVTRCRREPGVTLSRVPLPFFFRYPLSTLIAYPIDRRNLDRGASTACSVL
ncbi:hypothetical protein CNBC0090 [Cryptococcus deneoformans B-3501A]|uniref:Expressed protein n=1 Tax=Cryptococcus deneoformans (strain JEC21 / ATCC MYA-565) TaxID=214684 RepID=Q5KJB7_CRYD1|nr:expressed protein [Cryptococcus neoformans var. neoformans JEC21]XP_776943.1 hypothetical protein CNBC0090 [Cryptococcus neoformans var. neoformans B-3501A]AAW42539.1 expressed protein [Cryptococcus neoformans var. neoformans JEC21]EAL22296.1 hypothetical protein CNBC0090 [Cryptococcus neoformans var. neoformans B-3501A]